MTYRVTICVATAQEAARVAEGWTVAKVEPLCALCFEPAIEGTRFRATLEPFGRTQVHPGCLEDHTLDKYEGKPFARILATDSPEVD